MVSNDNFCDEELPLYESTTHSYVVRIWVEEIGRRSGSTIWRGLITSIPGGERKSIRSLDEIIDFIAPQLEQMGVRMNFSWRIRQRLNGIKKLLIRGYQSNTGQDEGGASP